MALLNSILETLFIAAGVYFAFSILGIINLYQNQDKWLPDFQKQMKTASFRLLLFVYMPVAMIKKLITLNSES